MGHYDSSYEYDRVENERKEKVFGEEAYDSVVSCYNTLPKSVPDRFKESLEDLKNWLSVNYKL